MLSERIEDDGGTAAYLDTASEYYAEDSAAEVRAMDRVSSASFAIVVVAGFVSLVSLACFHNVSAIVESVAIFPGCASRNRIAFLSQQSVKASGVPP